MKLEKNYEIPKKEINQELRKFLGNFTLNFWKVCTKLIEFQNTDETVSEECYCKNFPFFWTNYFVFHFVIYYVTTVHLCITSK